MLCPSVYAEVAALARERNDRKHRVDAIVDAAQLATARTELVPRKIQIVNAETVTGQKRARKSRFCLLDEYPCPAITQTPRGRRGSYQSTATGLRSAVMRKSSTLLTGSPFRSAVGVALLLPNRRAAFDLIDRVAAASKAAPRWAAAASTATEISPTRTSPTRGRSPCERRRTDPAPRPRSPRIRAAPSSRTLRIRER